MPRSVSLPQTVDAVDFRLLNEWQRDFPCVSRPFARIGEAVGLDEDQVIAALLHDVLEDGGPQWADSIRDAFGGQVLDLVQFCTDGLPDAQGQKSPWRERKERYLAHLRAAEGDGVLVSACDNLAAVLELAEAKSRAA